MKILRAIGAFFAKIGRWIANTAWVQPLLIVGGIFAIIFSIPYIKNGIEGLSADDTDYQYEYYKDRALTLSDNGQTEKILSYLEQLDSDPETYEQKIKKEFGSKFLLTFAQKNCQNCKSAVEGYTTAVNKGYAKGFKLYTILVDKTDDEGNYLAKNIYAKHTPLFDNLVEVFGEDSDDYPLYQNLKDKNKGSVVDSMIEKVKVLNEASTSDEGLETPLTFVVDLDKYNGGSGYYGTNGITELFFNYIDFDDSSSTNAETKAQVVRDIWNYQGYFNPDGIE